jgi:HlyD family secretion protein
MEKLLFPVGRICNPSSRRTDCKSVLQRKDRPGRLFRPAFCLCVALAAAGCGRPEAPAGKGAEPPVVRAVRPQLRTIRRLVGQPSFVEAYERTSIYPKVTAFITRWKADIGDKVTKNQELAELFAPELDEDWKTKKAIVLLDEKRIKFAKQRVEVARADIEAAKAALDEAEAILKRYQAQVDRWDSEVQRLRREVLAGVVDPQVLLESENQWKASSADRDAARASIARRKADLISAQATELKDEVAVEVAEHDLKVAESDAAKSKAWVDYLKLYAPFDGVIVGRNANTWDFILPHMGDPTAMERAPFLSPGGQAAPIYVVDRTDVVRIFVDIPEGDANGVRGEDAPKQGDELKRWLIEREKSGTPETGTKALVQIKGYKDVWLPATVTRTAWALNVKSRTLRAEIDMLNPESKVLPGMYAYGKVVVERPDVRVLPLAALFFSGNKTYCWMHKDGKAVQTEIQTGIDDGEWIEVTNRRVPAARGDSWVPLDGSEQVLLGDLSLLEEDEAVRLADGTEKASRAGK